ncbi:MAG: VOC family protein [Pseudomonadota bacterium]
MTKVNLEHLNITVPDPDRTAAMLERLFGWHVRWSGPSMGGGYTVHVGTDTDYLALYRPADPSRLEPFQKVRASGRVGGLNHIALTVDDLEDAETRILEAGFETLNHADYAPGRRFYFYDHDGIEYEVVSYQPAMSPMEWASINK